MKGRDMEERILKGLRDGVEVDVTIRFSTDDSSRVEVGVGSDAVISAGGTDVFYALQEARRGLESRGILLCCNGARLDVWPSGMSGQMSGGRAAYVRKPAIRPTEADLVDIFDPAPCSSVGSVEDQWNAVQAIYRRP